MKHRIPVFVLILLILLIPGCGKDPQPKSTFRILSGNEYDDIVTADTAINNEPAREEETPDTEELMFDSEYTEEDVSEDADIPTTDEIPVEELTQAEPDADIITVYLDPGHGGDAACETEFDGQIYQRKAGGGFINEFPANSLGTTTGTSGGNWSECDAVYQIALVTKAVLENAGYDVVMSRDDVHPASQSGGTAIGNWERGRRAAQYDYWVVLHADGGGNSGIHCVVYNSDSSFRSDLSDSFLSVMSSYDRPLYTASGYNTGYSGNSSGTLQAPTKYLEYGGDINKMLYIEAGFMDNADDLAYMTSDAGKEQIADAILTAIQNN